MCHGVTKVMHQNTMSNNYVVFKLHLKFKIFWGACHQIGKMQTVIVPNVLFKNLLYTTGYWPAGYSPGQHLPPAYSLQKSE